MIYMTLIKLLRRKGTALHAVSPRNIRKRKGMVMIIGNSLVVSLLIWPNLKRKVFHTRKKNQKIKQKCITS